MLKIFKSKKDENAEAFSEQKFGDLATQLFDLQRDCIAKNIPVMIVIDGWESSGKGYIINRLVRELDTRAFKVDVFQVPDAEDLLHPYSWHFWTKLPAKGDFGIYDRSFYYRMMNDLSMKEKEISREISHLEKVEKMLYDDGMILMKFFLNVKQATQKKRIDVLMKDKNREFLITDEDLHQSAEYPAYQNHFEKILAESNFDFAPWQIIDAEDSKAAAKEVMGLAIQGIQAGLARYDAGQAAAVSFSRPEPEVPDVLSAMKLDLSLSKNDYNKAIDDLQKEARDLLFELHTRQIPTVLAFEGMDAAGKGGAIKQLTRQMDPRFYAVNPTSAPSSFEKDHHYLWRFYNNFPEKGRMAIFDRSWYGRVLVERVEGFAKPAEWERAYGEINAMEYELVDFGTLVLKFFLYIDKDEQLARFNDRQAEKPYKITEEDWRNRDKWDAYTLAVNEMLQRTDKPDAPWILVEGNDKQFARVKVLKSFIEAAKKRIKRD